MNETNYVLIYILHNFYYLLYNKTQFGCICMCIFYRNRIIIRNFNKKSDSIFSVITICFNYFCYTVEPAFKGHPRDQAKVSLHGRCPLVREGEMLLLRITHQLNQNQHTTTPHIQKSSYSLITSLLLPHFRCLAAPACLTAQSSTTPWSLVAMSIMPTSAERLER